MGDRKFTHIFDAFGRITRIKIENNSLKFTSRIMDTAWYKDSKAANTILQKFFFMEPTNAPWYTKIPMVNLFSNKGRENNWV